MLRYLVDPIFQVINTAGKPATGGYIEVYLHGTRDKYYCASDFEGTLHPFKIPLDSLGSNIILADDANAYDIYVYNRYGSLLMSRYNVTPSASGSGGGSGGTVGEMQRYIGGIGPTYTPFTGDNVGHTLGLPKYGLQSLDIEYVGNFIERITDTLTPDGLVPGYISLKPGLYYVDCIIRYRQEESSVRNTLDEVLVYTGYSNANESIAYQLDSSGPEATDNRHNLRVTFVRHVTEYEGKVLYFAPSTPVNWKESYIQKLQIVKLDSVAVNEVVGIEKVIHDSTIEGDGTALYPLSIQTALDEKQDVISDLEDIRNGAALGETAVQPSSLASVATSGNYNDLSDKPTIPAAQVQSDWNQSNSSAVDYIKNKPTIPPAQVQSDWNEQDSSSKSFIQNKPSIPAAQVQCDWNQADSQAVDYIKNKPSIPTVPTPGNMLSVTNNVLNVYTTAGITDIQLVNALPENPVATVLYLIPEAP